MDEVGPVFIDSAKSAMLAKSANGFFATSSKFAAQLDDDAQIASVPVA